MTHIHDDPALFKDDVIAGFAAAYSRYVERVPDASGFVRADGPREGKVSLVVGGGSGHYPSYNGVVGAGFADGCVLGDVFTSPSTEQVLRVGRAADGGAGLVLAFGNYAGDRLNFAAAQQRLEEEGIPTRVVFVTDDIASAPPAEASRRRGIAGTFTVYKVGGAAADRGDGLEEVVRLMQAANDATFSYGVAFSGCTLPGQPSPLFEVAPGRMDFGLGIHGEPGTLSADWMPAHRLADALVERVLRERPAGADGRAAVLLNGLGASKYEELFLLYGHVARLLEDAGVTVVLPEVGELVTSLDMAGCSLTLTWLDDELERCWGAPADTAAFRRGGASVTGTAARSFPPRERPAALRDEPVPESEEGDVWVAGAGAARRALRALQEAVLANEERLGQIDAVAGDGDHGSGMARGARAATAAADAATGGAGSVLKQAGAAFGDKAGGTSGILWGILLSTIGGELGDTEPVDSTRIAAAVRSGADALYRAGGAEPGDKTLMDALWPFVETLERTSAAGAPLAEAWRRAADAAADAAESTSSLVPKVGRARPLAHRSVGTPDAGAVSLALIAAAVGTSLADTPAHP